MNGETHFERSRTYQDVSEVNVESVITFNFPERTLSLGSVVTFTKAGLNIASAVYSRESGTTITDHLHPKLIPFESLNFFIAVNTSLAFATVNGFDVKIFEATPPSLLTG